MILPSALLCLSGYLMICATTLSPFFAPEKCFFRIKISSLNFLPSGTTNPNFLLFSNVPATSVISLFRTFVIIPSGESLQKYSGIRSTSTSSPFIAPPIESAEMNTSFSRPSHFTNPKPRLCLLSIPVRFFFFFFLAIYHISCAPDVARMILRSLRSASRSTALPGENCRSLCIIFILQHKRWLCHPLH